ncbi:hypothetical protein EYF80_012126 [Liparis tanakae]|uniref:Uncharacterized protein n=1 Tax=Liparis tanakae TaxID=230148 RepID=A0A4Z2IHX9_9TELE|nr:hypothetical protein EYF80_012126 [Liparis tanakae]
MVPWTTFVTTVAVVVVEEEEEEEEVEEDLRATGKIVATQRRLTLPIICSPKVSPGGLPVQQAAVLCDLHLQPGLDVQQHLVLLALPLQHLLAEHLGLGGGGEEEEEQRSTRRGISGCRRSLRLLLQEAPPTLLWYQASSSRLVLDHLVEVVLRSGVHLHVHLAAHLGPHGQQVLRRGGGVIRPLGTTSDHYSGCLVPPGTSSWFFFMLSSSSVRVSICMVRSILAMPSSPISIFSPAMSASTV